MKINLHIDDISLPDNATYYDVYRALSHAVVEHWPSGISEGSASMREQAFAREQAIVRTTETVMHQLQTRIQAGRGR
ncbi:hypothetical protein BCT30_14105 [Enterovibrio norvegicus]|uniref:hypothetical protein n=1 Tax=Enterovibrio norvegicus TaxID=188144 RepID=UPI000C823108|nr:hypothetical protein [Enterovibrio norvegicus]MCC4800623.1 hypothetical protein [Enterovibrio norvegicus]PMI38591.1 hypothetical protein BCU46_01010 [Enterovibrio norvegicus]PMN51858.1 hypothetical protein BCT30_14105 [Enterovibrio norvegicus]